jgi:hypothetical protein
LSRNDVRETRRSVPRKRQIARYWLPSRITTVGVSEGTVAPGCPAGGADHASKADEGESGHGEEDVPEKESGDNEQPHDSEEGNGKRPAQAGDEDGEASGGGAT